MRRMILVGMTWAVLLGGGATGAEIKSISDLVTTKNGRIVVTPPAVDERYKNPWPAAWEEEFQRRADFVIRQQSRKPITGVNTFFENEKRTYGYLMAQALGGRADTALKLLQTEDNQAKEWHRETEGIDYYACFTLKHQIRKYFLFGNLLAPEYKQRMYRGAKKWTEKDPLRRPHYAFKKAGPNWGPDQKNSWVDVRTTENLFLMRDTSVYLMAEETKNEATRRLYKDHLLTYAKSLYRVGQGEWDSENYHGHCFGALLNLYDFAKDAEVKSAAKACLDFAMTAGAVKYYRGGFNGPTKRDYNHVQPFGGSAPAMLWLYFGDTPHDNTHFESDEIHVLTSSYRPPAAVVQLAHKNFKKPLEIFASKAVYEAPQRGDFKSPPAYHETHYFGHSFQMGSLIEGTSTDKGDVNGFKIMAFDSERGVSGIQCVPGPDPHFVGSPQYAEGKVAGRNRVAQNGNVALWLVEKGDAPWLWVLPKRVRVEQQGGVTFFRAERTWFAFHPVNLQIDGVNDRLTEQIASGKGDRTWATHQVVSARGRGGKYSGFALEVGERETHGDYDAFKAKVLSKARVDASQLDDGVAAYTAADGKSLKLQFAAKPTASKVWRDGQLHDWNEHGQYVYRSGTDDKGVINLKWLGGTLTVRAGSDVFTGTVDEKGHGTFRNGK